VRKGFLHEFGLVRRWHRRRVVDLLMVPSTQVSSILNARRWR